LDARRRYSGWFLLAWAILGFMAFLSGFVSGNIATMAIGAAMKFGTTSAYLAAYVKNERRIKRALELALAFLTFGILSYGYVVTGNLILGAIVSLMTAMTLFAFTVSYLLPRIRREPEGCGQK